jgi:hypothetical protein
MQKSGLYKDFARKTTPEKNTPPAIPAAKPQAITTGLVTPSQFLPPTEKKDDDEKFIAASSSSSKDKKKKGPSKNDMRMFAKFLKTFKEENNIEDSGKEDDFESFSLETTSICKYDRNLFWHDPVCTEDALDAIRALKTSQS